MRLNLWIYSLVAVLTLAGPASAPAQQSPADEQRKLDGAQSFLEQFVVRRIVEAVGVEIDVADSFEREAGAEPETWAVAGTLSILDFTGNRERHPYRSRLEILCDAYDRPGCWNLRSLALGQWTYSETSSTIATMADLAGTVGSADATSAATSAATSGATSGAEGEATQAANLPQAEPAPDQMPGQAAPPDGSADAAGGQDIDLLRELAGNGDPEAQYQLAEKFRVGNLVEQDFAMAIELYRLSAEQGYAASQFRLGELYEDGSQIERDLGKAIQSYLQAAEQGHAGAQYALAHIYHLGSGVPQDMATAMVWYHKAAEQGDEWSQLALGDQYRIGLAVPRDLAQSTGWYRQAAESGNIFAQYELGNAYRYGNGVEKNVAEAMKWYRASAEAGNPSAKLALSQVQAEEGAGASLAGQAPGGEVQQDPGSEELVSSGAPAQTSETDLAFSNSVMGLSEDGSEAGETDRGKLLSPTLDQTSAGEPLTATDGGATGGAASSGSELAFAAPPPISDEETIKLLLVQADEQMGRLALTTPEGDNAYETYQQILSIQPGHEVALAGLRSVGVKYAQLAERAQSRGKIERARAYTDKAMELAPDHPNVQAMDAALHVHESDAAPPASGATGDGAPSAPAPVGDSTVGAAGGPDIQVSALTDLPGDRPGAAGPSETVAIDRSQAPKPELLTSGLLYAVSGLDAHQLGNYDEAIEFYSLAIDAGDLPDKSLAYVFNNRGASYRNLSQYNRAIEDYDAAIRLNPDYATAFYNRGIAYDLKGFHGLAIDDFDTAIRLNPDLPDAYNQRGLAYSRDGRYDIAIQNFSEAIRLDPELDTAYFNRGLAYQSKGEAERAAEDIRKSYALDPANPAYSEKLKELGIL